MATIKEIARACNVSVATVSNILNHKPGASEETRKMVMKKVKELNYTPNTVARNLKTKNTKSIGVIVEDMTIFSIPDIVDGITEHCEEENYQILLINLRLFKKYQDTYYHRDDYYGLVKDEIWKLIAKQVEGIIYVAAHERTIRCIPEDLPIPAVMAYGYTDSAKVPSVVVNDEDGAFQITSHVIGQGHRKIGVITGKRDSPHAQERLLGYQRALYENGILYNPALICTGDWTRISGYKCTDGLLERQVTAIFCMNDLMAGGVYDRLEELELRPGEDISIAGYDNRELSGYYKPPLSTITLPLHDIGYEASEIMLKMLQKKELDEADRIHRVNCYPLIRKSVKKM
ncbi:LacI family transcriptional regulator [Petralouisia muris]|jgi:LacI family transcriptional regulator|uniref:LacI family transcriptional regulator n=1 Tax=Petralouisia muris TaxID=3032872 RepID=A0AC61RXA6_9FIRM|nr:LacI family DNA-binding transcriptional regulator [Petralouisia muris]TGY96470.1 LacI family transcriptional regulator [Petralouisia muris]